MRIESKQPSPEEFNRLVEEALHLPIGKEMAESARDLQWLYDRPDLRAALAADEVWGEDDPDLTPGEKKILNIEMMRFINKAREKIARRSFHKDQVVETYIDWLAMLIGAENPQISLAEIEELLRQRKEEVEKSMKIIINRLFPEVDIPSFQEIRNDALISFSTNASHMIMEKYSIHNQELWEALQLALLKKFGLEF